MDRERVLEKIVRVGRQAIEQDGAEVLILGCAGLGDLAARASAEIGVPIIDPNAAALKLCETLVDLKLSHSRGRPPVPLPPARGGADVTDPPGLRSRRRLQSGCARRAARAGPASPSSARRSLPILDADLARRPGPRPWPGLLDLTRQKSSFLPTRLTPTSIIEPSTRPVDSWETLTKGAALGGHHHRDSVHPGARQSMPLGEGLAYFRDEGERESVTDFAIHARLNIPSAAIIEQRPDAFALGVPSFKLVMAYRKRGIMWDGAP